MGREEIELSEHLCRSFIDEDYEGYIEGEDLGFSYIDSITGYVDMEKSYSDIDVIIRRNSDSKLFKFDYCESNYRSLFEDVIFPIKARETFSRTVKTIVYE